MSRILVLYLADTLSVEYSAMDLWQASGKNRVGNRKRSPT